MMAEPVVSMPLHLTSEMLRAVRKDPLTSFEDKDRENAHIGWLLCAWDVLVQQSLADVHTKQEKDEHVDGVEGAHDGL